MASGDPDTEDEDNDDNDDNDDGPKSLTVRIAEWIFFPDPDSMSPLMRLFYHLVAFIASLAGVIITIVGLPIRVAKRLQILYVVCLVAPVIAFWLGGRWPQTPTIVWTSPGTPLEPDSAALRLLSAEMHGILEQWRSAEREVEQMVKAGEEGHQRVSEAHENLLLRFEKIEAEIADGGLMVAGGEGSAKELVAAKQLWEEVRDLKRVLEDARQTFVDTTKKFDEVHNRFFELEDRVQVVEVAIAEVIAKQEGSSTLVEKLIVATAATATDNENDRTRCAALETRVEEVVGRVEEVVRQHNSSDEGVSTRIATMVEEAMSKEHTGKADFALYSAGARVLVSLTSPTMELWPKSLRDRVIGVVTNRGFAAGSLPEEALSPDMHAGRCWPFEGGVGTLGVGLAQRIYVEEITVYHIPRTASVHDASSAPMAMEVWGLVEGAENVDKVAKWRQSHADDGTAKPEVLGVAPYILLSTFTYDITLGKEAQTFPADKDLVDLQVGFGVVVLAVKSNWGGGYTCLYRLGVHGRREVVGSNVALLTTASPSSSSPSPTLSPSATLSLSGPSPSSFSSSPTSVSSLSMGSASVSE